MRETFNAQSVANACILWIQDFFNKNGKDSNAVVGISGGKDSSVVAALCVKALGVDRVIGVLMPNGIQNDISDSYRVCEALGIKHYTVNIRNSYEELVEAIDEQGIEFTNQARINLPCRLRMSTLYAVSQCLNGRVANTCNKSEEYIGYSTRWGDSVGDFSPLVNLLSDEVVAIGKYLNILPEDLIVKTPSDGLCGKTDEDNFGFSNIALNKYIEEGESGNGEETDKKIKSLHEKNLFKQRQIPQFFPGLTNAESFFE